MKISVIIPVYNMGKYLKKCLDSIICQTIDSLEIFAINDGSTDNSLEILNEYKEKYKNVIVYSQINQGQAAAKNYGILHTKGKYVIFMDPDDYYPNDDCLRQLYECAEQQKVLICGGIMINNNNVNHCDSITDIEVAEKYYRNNLVNTKEYNDIYHHQRFLFRRDLFIKNNILFPIYKRFEDPPFTVKALCTAGEFYAIDKPVYVHRIAYKRIRYTLNVCIDMLNGIRDVIEVCKKNNLDAVYERLLKNIYNSNIIPFYAFSFRGITEIDETIMKINDLLCDWKGNAYSVLFKDDVIQRRKISMEKYKQICNILTSGKKVILYGAGGTANIFLDVFSEISYNILGIAVTQEEKRSSIGKYEIKCIDSYMPMRDNIVVLITTLPKYQDEIYYNLENKQFRNIINVDINAMLLAEAILDNNS